MWLLIQNLSDNTSEITHITKKYFPSKQSYYKQFDGVVAIVKAFEKTVL